MTAEIEPPKLPLRMSVAEYFDFAEAAVEKQEYRNGEVVAMSGGTVRHSLIISNLNGALWNQLKGKPCRTYDSNLRVRSPRLAVYSYPDVSVICGDVNLDADDPRGQSVVNPTLLAEVLSPSSEVYDRVKKFERYMAIDSLREYVLVDQDRAHLECRFRESDGRWRLDFSSGLEAVVKLRSLDISLPLNEIYAGVVFPAGPSPTTEA